MTVRSEGDALGTVVVCAPVREYTSVDDPARQNLPEAADAARARSQHAALRDALAEGGAAVVDVGELGGHPNSVFVRDVALSTPLGFVALRMGLPARRGEEAWMTEHLMRLGEEPLGRIEAPATVEGGDVVLLGDVALVGLSGRTNEEGVRQLATLLEPAGFRVRTCLVPPPHLHLGGILSAVGGRSVVCVKGAVPEDLVEGLDVLWVRGGADGDASANVICLGEGEVLADASGDPRAGEVLERAGVTVRALDLSEFRKGAGGPTCLILPVTRG